MALLQRLIKLAGKINATPSGVAFSLEKSMIIWDGIKFSHEPDNEKANALIDRGLAQNAGKEDGLSLAYAHQFPLKSQVSPMTYETREIRAEKPSYFGSKAEVVEPIADKVEDASCSEADWEDYKEQYKESTGAMRARKESVIEWMHSEGLI